MRFIVYCLVLSCIVTYSYGQKDFKTQFGDADYSFLFEEYDKAVVDYEELYQRDSTNANINYHLGVCYLHISADQNGKIKSIPFLEYAANHIDVNFQDGTVKERDAPPDVLFYLGTAYKYAHEFDKAIETFTKYLGYLHKRDIFYKELVEREIQACKNAKEIITSPITFDVDKETNIDNSAEYTINCPAISADHRSIVFTKGSNANLPPEFSVDPITDDYELDRIYFSQKVGVDWTTPIDITDDLGATAQTLPASINQDGTILYLIRDDNDDGNIYTSFFDGSKWSEMEKLPKTINTSKWETHASISPDGKTIYFTSEKKGGYGGLDIYKSSMNEEGEWSEPQNLGPNINTEYDEETPYITENGLMIFFSSQGHNSMGGFDIFFSELDENDKWIMAENIGYPINTVGNDLYYVPVSNGDYAFYPFLYNRNEYVADNTFGLIQIVSGPDFYTINIDVLLAENESEVPENFSLYLISEDGKDTLVTKNPTTTRFQIQSKLRTGKYNVFLTGDNYQPFSKEFEISDEADTRMFDLALNLVPESTTTTVTTATMLCEASAVYFDYDSYKLTTVSKEKLNVLVDFIKEYPDVQISLSGYTDSRGSTEYNKELSEKRAKAVADYMASNGISSKNLIIKGLGSQGYIAKNQNADGSDNPEGRKYNRRVEFKLEKAPENIKLKEIEVPDELKYSGNESSEQPNIDLNTSNSTSTTEYRYTIQVFLADKSISIERLKDLTDVKEYAGSDGKYRYAVGEFKWFSSAMKVLEEIKKKGYEDAFVRRIKDL